MNLGLGGIIALLVLVLAPVCYAVGLSGPMLTAVFFAALGLAVLLSPPR